MMDLGNKNLSTTKKYGRLYLILLPILSLGACTDQSEDLEKWVEETLINNRSFVPEIKPAPVIQPKVYDVYHLRDPFLSRAEKISAEANEAKPSPPINRPLEFLESYKLVDLKLVGILIKSKKADALIEDPEGQVHAVKIGDHMGESYGRVHRIFENGLDLHEQVLNEEQKWVLRITRLYVETAP